MAGPRIDNIPTNFFTLEGTDGAGSPLDGAIAADSVSWTWPELPLEYIGVGTLFPHAFVGAYTEWPMVEFQAYNLADDNFSFLHRHHSLTLDVARSASISPADVTSTVPNPSIFPDGASRLVYAVDGIGVNNPGLVNVQRSRNRQLVPFRMRYYGLEVKNEAGDTLFKMTQSGITDGIGSYADAIARELGLIT